MLPNKCTELQGKAHARNPFCGCQHVAVLLPIGTNALLSNRPDFDYADRAAERHEIIYTTYCNAIAAGDKNVYFIDSESFFGDTERPLCTLDRYHPNDLGFHRMVSVIEPVIKKILEQRYTNV